MIKLTKQHITAAKTAKGGFTKKQIEALKAIGISGPSKAAGKTVSEDWYQSFLKLSGNKSPKKVKVKKELKRESVDNIEVIVIANTLLKARRGLLDDYNRQFCNKISRFPEQLTVNQKMHALTLAKRFEIEDLVQQELAYYKMAGKLILTNKL